MPLTLVTGPANSAKAGVVLGGLRDRIEQEPVLVVPAFEDVERSQRELADRGAIFGARVVRFKQLFRTIASRAAYAARSASDLQRRLLVEEAIEASSLRVLAESAARPGFARATERLVIELERSMVEPARLTQALRAWAGDGPRRAYADEVAEIYRRYRAGLESAGLVDDDLFAGRALEALRRDPKSWGATPVHAYGFDDFTPLELAALRDLSLAGAHVTVSLPYEAGHDAFRAVAGTREDLAALADDVVELEASDDHYAEGSREPLHALERGLFREHSPTASPGTAVRLHLAGGERAEMELCGAEVLGMLRAGTEPGDIAVVLRDPAALGSLVEQVFGAYEIPYSIDRSVPLAHTGLGRGLLGLLRAALLDRTADDLLAWLRTPGHLREPRLADRLEAEMGRRGITSADGGRALWEETPGRWRLEELDRLAAARGPGQLLDALERALGKLFAGPYRRAGHLLEGAELDDSRAFTAASAALGELHALAPAAGAGRLGAQRIHDTLAELPVRVGENPQPDRVQVASPEAVRARRFAAVLVCGLVAGEFPRRARPEAFLPDADRRELAQASGLALPLREDQLERERYLFYVCCSRAERELVLSHRSSDEEGNPQTASPLLDAVRDVFPDIDEGTRERPLAAVAWTPEEAPTAAEWERAVALAGPRRSQPAVGTLGPHAVRRLASRDAVSAGALERFADCPVKWLVEDVLRPDKLEPDPEQMARGAYAHRVLELTFTRLRERTGSRRITDGNLAEAERILVEALDELRGEFRLSSTATRVRAAVRRLEFDLLRHLRHEAGRGGVFEPEHLELRFGFEESGHPAVELEGGIRVRGVIDRVDTWRGWALVRDYKSGRVESDYKLSDWEKKNRFQAVLYMLAAERALGLRPAGGVYVPLSGKKRQPRGLVARELLDELGDDFVDNDVKPVDEFTQLTGFARDAIAAVARDMREGRLASCPDSCAYRGGCSHPSICRVEA